MIQIKKNERKKLKWKKMETFAIVKPSSKYVANVQIC